MEKIEEMNTETLTNTTEVQQEVGQQVSGNVQVQNDEVHQAERIQMRNAMHNLPDFDVQMARRHPLRILLAEDSLVNIKIALWFLRKLGYHADVAFNGIEVIDALKRRSYDAIWMRKCPKWTVGRLRC
jgi:PleD family two-component response regulator